MTNREKTNQKPLVLFWIALFIGITSFISSDIAYFTACLYTGFSCDGDIAGGIMFIYAMLGIPLSIIGALISFLLIVFQLIKNKARLNYIHFFGLLIYTATFLFYTYLYLGWI